MSLYGGEAAGSTPLPPHEAEAWVLSTEEGQAILREVAKVETPLPADVARWRRHATQGAVAAAIRLADGRRRGRAKFSLADRMWFDPVGLEQATSETVARHKAARLEAPVVVDLCSGIGGDTLALAGQSTVLAVDLDPGMCLRVAWNAGVHAVGDRVLPCRSKAEAFVIPHGAWVHVDPDRRASGTGRARRIADYTPGLKFLEELTSRVPGGGIKLSPASDFELHFNDPSFEVEIISLDGECKEATVWFGAAAGCRTRATALPEGITWTDRDGDPSAIATVSPVSAYVYDPDPAVGRAGLLDSFATAHGLTRIRPGEDYLTSERLVRSGLVPAFEVRDVVPVDVKQLARSIREHAIGTLEIKVRGLDLTPEKVRAALRPEGNRSATLILCGGRGRSLAILASRVL